MPAGRTLAPGSGGFVALIAAFMTMTAMATDINLPAIPAIMDTLGTSLTLAQLTVTTFFVGFAFGQAAWGPLSDAYGRRPALLIGCSVYIAATVGCALSPGIGTLLALRVVQGFGAGSGPVVGRAIIRDLFQGPAMARVMSLCMAAFIIAPIVAPSVGALLLLVTGWRGIFAFLTVYGVVLLLLAATTLEESLKRPDKSALHLGRLVSTLAAIFRDPASRRPALVAVLVYGTLNVYLANASAIFMDARGLSPQQFGLVFAAIALFSAAGSLANSRLVHAVTLPRIVLGALLAGVAVAVAALAAVAAGSGTTPVLVAAFGGFFVCFSLAAANTMTLALAPHGRAVGAAAAALGFAQAVVPAGIGSAVAVAYDGTPLPALLTTLVLFLLGVGVFGSGRAAIPAAVTPR